MKLMIYFLCLGFSALICSCNGSWSKIENSLPDGLLKKDTISISEPVLIDSILDKKDSVASVIALDTQKIAPLQQGEAIDTRNVNPEEVIKFAETLVGTPYVYGSTDAKVGFDCSGFITYVFNNFKIKVPRSSVQFTNVGKTVPVESAKRGDIVLFTNPGYNNTNSNVVGHMGLITSNENGIINFIHSTSGKAMSVANSTLNERYKNRFIRVGRIFPQNDN
jgi:cell wall-associated NlpC family hydrolase